MHNISPELWMSYDMMAYFSYEEYPPQKEVLLSLMTKTGKL